MKKKNPIAKAILILGGVFIGALAGAVCMSFLMAFPFKWLWNSGMVAIGLPRIDYWTSWQLYLLFAMIVVHGKGSCKNQ